MASFKQTTAPVDTPVVSRWIQEPGVYSGSIVSVKVTQNAPKDGNAEGNIILKLLFMTAPVEGVSHDLGNGQLAKQDYFFNPNKPENFDKALNQIRLNLENIGALAPFDAATTADDTLEGFEKALVDNLQDTPCFATVLIEPTELFDKETNSVGAEPWNAPVLPRFGSFIHADKAILEEKFHKRKDRGYLKLNKYNGPGAVTATSSNSASMPAESASLDDIVW